MQRILVALSAAILLAGAAGCREEGPAERAGRQIDEAVEGARESTEDTLEKVDRKVDEAVEKTREAAEDLKEESEEGDG
jgi:hyperosmotically inducible protein